VNNSNSHQHVQCQSFKSNKQNVPIPEELFDHHRGTYEAAVDGFHPTVISPLIIDKDCHTSFVHIHPVLSTVHFIIHDQNATKFVGKKVVFKNRGLLPIELPSTYQIEEYPTMK